MKSKLFVIYAGRLGQLSYVYTMNLSGPCIDVKKKKVEKNKIYVSWILRFLKNGERKRGGHPYFSLMTADTINQYNVVIS